MVDAARKEGKEPIEFLNNIVSNFKNLFTELGISYDQFVRTTDRQVHWPGAQALWKKLVDAGDIYKKEYEGLYCVGHEAFITEKDLVDGKCPDHGTVPEFIKEENYFFKLSKYSDVLKEKIESGELAIIPDTRRNEIVSFISSGLEDVSFSRPRKSDWPEGLGIPVPGDNTQVMYVWCDALSNYITALGYGRDEELYKKFWPGMHVMGKDILRFHAAIWPAMLLSAGLPLPKTLLVHGFITSAGKKMSKSLGNVIDPEELLQEYGVDALRYYLARHISPFEDGDITREHFKEMYNANLANGLGNLISRVMQLAQTHLQEAAEVRIVSNPPEYTKSFERLDIKGAIDEIFLRIQALDQRIAAEEPYKVIKVDVEKGRDIIRSLVIELLSIAHWLRPFMPATSAKMEEAFLKNVKPENLFPRKD
jgi:methionyl-tRNA synthetase